MRIEVQRAGIATAAVELTTIKVSGKQMTLAVFRQLDEDVLALTDDPLIWGRVNYCTKGCYEERAARLRENFPVTAHIHVIIQEGDTIKAGIIFAPPRTKTRAWEMHHRDDSWFTDSEL